MKLTEIKKLLMQHVRWHQYDDSTLYHPDNIYLRMTLVDDEDQNTKPKMISESTTNLIRDKVNLRGVIKKRVVVDYDGRQLFKFNAYVFKVEGKEEDKGTVSDIYIVESMKETEYVRAEIYNAIYFLNTSELSKSVLRHLRYY